MNGIIVLSVWDLSLAAFLVLSLALVSHLSGLAMTRPILVAAGRAVLQLGLIGLVLKAVFAVSHPGIVGLMALVMFGAAAWEIRARQKRPLLGAWGMGVGAASLFLSTLAAILITLFVIISPEPWYTPQYAIPILGMLLGNTMNGISLAMDRLTHDAWDKREVIEARLMLGASGNEALSEIRRDTIRAGMIPILNAMAAAGIVNLPGMMTGQILAGNAPQVAVNYQILILFVIASSTGFGAMLAVHLASRRLFDRRQRLRLDRVAKERGQ